MKKNTLWTLPALSLVGGVVLTACGTGDETSGSTSSQDRADGSRIHSQDDDLWVRAADSEMSSLFGTIENLTDEELEIVAAESDVSDRVELHEIIVDDDGQEVMQEIEGGFPIPAEGALEMAPGGDHLMLIGLHGELQPGDPVEVSLEFEDGSHESIEAIVKEDGGQDEPYDHGDHSDHSDHDDDHGDHGGEEGSEGQDDHDEHGGDH